MSFAAGFPERKGKHTGFLQKPSGRRLHGEDCGGRNIPGGMRLPMELNVTLLIRIPIFSGQIKESMMAMPLPLRQGAFLPTAMGFTTWQEMPGSGARIGSIGITTRVVPQKIQKAPCPGLTGPYGEVPGVTMPISFAVHLEASCSRLYPAIPGGSV